MTATVLDLRLDPRVAAVDRRRGHRFQPPKADLVNVPGLLVTERMPDPTVWLHYFTGSWDWWITELDVETFQAFGLVASSLCPRGELGYVDLVELAVTVVDGGVLVNLATGSTHGFSFPIERDCHWTPVRLSTIREGLR